MYAVHADRATLMAIEGDDLRIEAFDLSEVVTEVVDRAEARAKLVGGQLELVANRPDFAYPGGTGLGLFIAWQLAVASGGSLELEWSQVDAGSTFVLRLPASVS